MPVVPVAGGDDGSDREYLPSSIDIPKTRTEGGYTTFYLLRCRTPAGRVWGVAKRFSEFAELQRRTVAEVPGLRELAFPTKSSWFGSSGSDQTVVAERQKSLGQWLNSVRAIRRRSLAVCRRSKHPSSNRD